MIGKGVGGDGKKIGNGRGGEGRGEVKGCFRGFLKIVGGGD